MSIADEIRKLDALRQEGTITEAEFEQAKRGLLSSMQGGLVASLEEFSKRENIWATALHLSPLLGYLIPVAGLVVPVVLWQTRKESPLIDRHGRAVMNWILSQMIWWGVSVLFCLLLVGIPMLWIVGVLVVVFPIIGAVRAHEGRVWSYPLCFRFFKEV
jgi:hypothetical protein